MIIFGSDSSKSGNCFVVFDHDIQKSKGIMLRLPDAGFMTLNTGKPSPIVCISAAVDFKERVSSKPCFNGVTYLYSFGSDVGNLTLSYLLFSGPGVQKLLGSNRTGQSSDDGTPVVTMMDMYRRNRVSLGKRAVQLEFGGQVFDGYIVGIEFGTESAEHNILSAKVSLLIPELPNSGNGKTTTSAAQR